MPANFPEVWLDRVIENFRTSHIAPWLDGISEMNTEIVELGEGTATESNMIHVATTDFEAEILINNTTYPIPVQVYQDGTISLKLDKYQTKVVTVSDDIIMGSSYDMIDAATRNTIRPINATKFAKAIHSIAPMEHTLNTPVLKTTGGAEGLTDPTGRFRLVYEDIVAFKDACDKAKFSAENRRLVLCDNHWNDLLLDRKKFGDQLVNYTTGKPAPIISGFQMFQYIAMPRYTDAGIKKPFGAMEEPNDRIASVAFLPEGIAKKTGLTKQYFVKAAENPSGQTNDLAYRHYFIATPFRNMYIGAII